MSFDMPTLREKKETLKLLVLVARTALRRVYSPKAAREIEHSLRRDPVELISTAARDLSNDIEKAKRSRS